MPSCYPIRSQFALATALLFMVLPVRAQTFEQTSGPPGTALGGVVAFEGDVIASGSGIGSFRRSGGTWTAEPLPLRLGSLYRVGETLFAESSRDLYRSADGTAWEPAWERSGVTVDVASIVGDSLLVIANDSLFITGDGVTWRSVIEGRTILDEEGEATDDSLAFLMAATRTPDGALWASASGGTQFGVFRSLDGATWEFISPGDFDFVRVLYVTSAGDLYALLNGVVLRYEAESESWIVLSGGLESTSALAFVEVGEALFVRGQGSTGTTLHRLTGSAWEPVSLPVDAVVAIEPADDGLFVIGLDELFRGPGDGSWTAIDDGLIASFAQPYTLGADVVASTRRGWVRSTDAGDVWEPVAFPEIGAVYDFEGVAFGTGGDDVYRSTDAGASWQTVNEGIEPGFFHDRRIRDMAAYEGTYYGGLYSSRAIVHQGGEVVGGVYRSTDGGSSWALFGSGFPTNANGFPAGVFRLATTADYLVAATEEGLARIAHDDSAWEMLTSPVASAFSVAALVALNGRLYLATSQAVFVSEDGGATWTERTDGLPEGEGIGLSLSFTGDTLYALLRSFTEPGSELYRLEGDTWVDSGVAVPDWVRFYQGIAAGDSLFFGSANHGVWRLAVDDGTVASESGAADVQAPALAPAFPNPTAGRATLRLSLPEAADVRVEVFDLLGRQVATLADGRYKAGRHALRLDGAGFSVGTYIVVASVETAGIGGTQVFRQKVTLLH